MPKNTKKKIVRCDRHQFSLKPKSQYTIQPQYFHASFCQLNEDKERKMQTQPKPNCLNCPAFNKDSNFATPTFVLSTEKVIDTVEGERLKAEHQQRMVNFTEEKSSINVAKPRSKNHFCSVCRQNYEDYMDHIESPFHKKKIKSSEFNKYIFELSSRFSAILIQDQPKTMSKVSTCNIQANRNNVEEDLSVEIISNPCKKVKLNAEEPVREGQIKVQAGYANFYSQSFPSQTYPFKDMPIQVPTPAFPPRVLPGFGQPMGNYNFSINMNLYLNDMNMPNYMNPHIPPYFQCKEMALHRLNHQLAIANNFLYASAANRIIHNLAFEGPPATPRPSKPISYIVIDQ